MAGSIEIPVRDTDEVIKLYLDQLPEGDEVLGILRQARAQLNIWINLALEYYKQQKIDVFIKILESSRIDATDRYRGHIKDYMRVYYMLAAYYIQEANKEKNKDKKEDLFEKVISLNGTYPIIYDQNYFLVQGFFYLVKGESFLDHRADRQFYYELNRSPNNILCLLGKACIAFNKKDYRGARAIYETFRTNPNCPAGIRLGMLHGFKKLSNQELARLPFERALQLDGQCVDELVGLSVLKFVDLVTLIN